MPQSTVVLMVFYPQIFVNVTYTQFLEYFMCYYRRKTKTSSSKEKKMYIQNGSDRVLSVGSHVPHIAHILKCIFHYVCNIYTVVYIQRNNISIFGSVILLVCRRLNAIGAVIAAQLWKFTLRK